MTFRQGLTIIKHFYPVWLSTWFIHLLPWVYISLWTHKTPLFPAETDLFVGRSSAGLALTAHLTNPVLISTQTTRQHKTTFTAPINKFLASIPTEQTFKSIIICCYRITYMNTDCNQPKKLGLHDKLYFIYINDFLFSLLTKHNHLQHLS